jgi:hypothetical protein
MIIPLLRSKKISKTKFKNKTEIFLKFFFEIFLGYRDSTSNLESACENYYKYRFFKSSSQRSGQSQIME